MQLGLFRACQLECVWNIPADVWAELKHLEVCFVLEQVCAGCKAYLPFFQTFGYNTIIFGAYFFDTTLVFWCFKLTHVMSCRCSLLFINEEQTQRQGEGCYHVIKKHK